MLPTIYNCLVTRSHLRHLQGPKQASWSWEKKLKTSSFQAFFGPMPAKRQVFRQNFGQK
jgi:hypothetical protein